MVRSREARARRRELRGLRVGRRRSRYRDLAVRASGLRPAGVAAASTGSTTAQKDECSNGSDVHAAELLFRLRTRAANRAYGPGDPLNVSSELGYRMLGEHPAEQLIDRAL